MVDAVSLVAIGGLIGTFVGIATTIHYHQKTEALIEEKKQVTWEELRNEAKTLSSEIDEAFEPDIVVTPGLRGATVANLMRGVYESLLVYVGVREDKRMDHLLPSEPKGYVHVSETTKYNHYLPASVVDETDKKVLILDAYTESGQSLLSFENFLRDHGFPENNIRRATIFCSEESNRDGNDPDFYSIEISSPFYFPWGKAV